MGRVMHRLAPVLLTAVLAAGLAGVALPSPVAGFSGFGASSADATYGTAMTFDVALPGGAPDRLELLLEFAGSDGTFVAPVAATGTSAEYVWDAASQHITPNTRITYRWRATSGSATTLSSSGTLLYDDDRPGLDWRQATIGAATVHWYGGAEAQARRFGELSAAGAQRAEDLLGHRLDGPIDIFVYDTRDEFFGALGPGAREWTGAATYPAIRTIFMWLGGGPSSYLETTIVHEVTHVVFDDATANPFHEPAKWFNEGLATWAEQQSAASERATVQFEAGAGELFAFPAIAEQFPIGSRGSSLSYAMGATMVDMIIHDHGASAIARIATAYREGSSDADALAAGTGESAEALYAAFYDAFGVVPPQPIAAAPLLPSNVDKPPAGAAPSGDGNAAASPTAAATPGSGEPAGQPAWWILLIAAVVAVAGFVSIRAMRRVGTSGSR
jgi:hypothetical protein